MVRIFSQIYGQTQRSPNESDWKRWESLLYIKWETMSLFPAGEWNSLNRITLDRIFIYKWSENFYKYDIFFKISPLRCCRNTNCSLLSSALLDSSTDVVNINWTSENLGNREYFRTLLQQRLQVIMLMSTIDNITYRCGNNLQKYSLLPSFPDVYSHVCNISPNHPLNANKDNWVNSSFPPL